jgi:hypothetical protein
MAAYLAFVEKHVPVLADEGDFSVEDIQELVLKGCLPSLQEQIKEQFEQAAKEAEVYITLHRQA